MAHAVASAGDSGGSGGARRDFLYLTAGAFAGLGTALALWPFFHSMNPSADVLAVGSTEVDLAPIELGQRITVQWRGKPVFIDRRTPERIALAEAGDRADPHGGPGGAYLLGLAFGFGWTPCIGPVLGGILTLAATNLHVADGVAPPRARH